MFTKFPKAASALSKFALTLSIALLSFAGNALAQAVEQRDLADVLKKFILRNSSIWNDDTLPRKPGKVYKAFAGAAGYTLNTRLAATIGANAAFYADKDVANLSVINMGLTYTQNEQILLPLQSNIWTPGNMYYIVGDWKYLKYPQYSFGLGGHSTLDDADLMDYSYIGIRETILRKLEAHFYAGIGYNLDYHWNITEAMNSGRGYMDYIRYGKTDRSVSSGLTANLLYDTRDNILNPSRSFYAYISYRPNTTSLGSEANWRSLLVDVRKYVRFPAGSDNILAFWSYNWLTLQGDPPYLDLPSTGWDPFQNLGRGYLQSRFRSPNLLYLESEYRMKLMRSGLVGAVLFINAQSVSEWPGNRFETILPAAGAGLRVKVNKHSNTNVTLDYGFGIGGSNGIFVNLGEVF